MSHHITKIQGRRFKGRDFSDDLSPLTIIYGPNFSGKTARLDAIRFAILGHLPEQGKTAAAMMELGDGLRMEVSATLNTGEIITREIWKEGGGLKTSGTKTDWKTPLMDAAEYFGLTEAQRLEYIAARAEIKSDVSEQALLEKVKTALAGCAETASDFVMKMVGGTIATRGVSEGIAELTKKGGILPGEYTAWNSRAKDSVGAVRTMTELKNREAECSAETIATLKQRQQAAHAALDASNKELGELANAVMNANRAKARREEIQAFLATPPADWSEKKRIAAEKLEAASKEIEAIVVPAVSADALGQLNREIGTATGQVENLSAQIERNRSKLAELEHQEACPYCKSKRKDWRKTVETELSEEHAQLSAQVQQAAAKRDGLVKQAAELQVKLNEAAEALKRLNNAKADANECKHGLERIAGHEREEASRREGAKGELDRLTVEAVDQSKVEAASATNARLKEERNAAQEAHEQALSLANDLKRAQEAFEIHEEAKQRVEAITIAGKLLKEEQGVAIASLFDGLLTKANFYTKDILPSPLAFHEGEVGRFDPSGRFITHRAFSGTEKAICYVAISAALSQQGALRIVILDELGRIDRDNQTKVLDRLWQAVKAGIIDQAIIAHTHAIPCEGWTEIPLP